MFWVNFCVKWHSWLTVIKVPFVGRAIFFQSSWHPCRNIYSNHVCSPPHPWALSSVLLAYCLFSCQQSWWQESCSKLWNWVVVWDLRHCSFLGIFWLFRDPFYFHTYFKISWPSSEMIAAGILIKIVLLLYVHLRSIAILTILSVRRNGLLHEIPVEVQGQTGLHSKFKDMFIWHTEPLFFKKTKETVKVGSEKMAQWFKTLFFHSTSHWFLTSVSGGNMHTRAHTYT